jgi:hypothetical protein
VLVAVEFVAVQVFGLGNRFTSVQGQLERRNQILGESKICRRLKTNLSTNLVMHLLDFNVVPIVT